DHADIYKDLEAYKLAFRRLINLVPNRGNLLAGFDSPIVAELSGRAFCPVDSFGIDNKDSKWQAKHIETSSEGTSFTVFEQEKEYAKFFTPLVGRFNVRNCLGVIVAAERMGIERRATAEALATFKSVKRRMQVRANIAEITLIDDFAHHPTAVRETLEAISQRYTNRRVVAVFEPRSWSSRKRVFQQDYETAFGAAEVVVIAPVFESFKLETSDQFSPNQLVEVLKEQGKQAAVVSGSDNIVEHLESLITEGDVIAVMSNGGFGGLHEKLLTLLEKKSQRIV
ncbi:MAG: UDP-N-acetylmuramate:L-alanyl-gamma-D-glutamyl-meso-diaminopimelate ligase, partial [Blastocatellia bacterium]|nr:UDP-N-acetylmuramate:L-alanyl-gamma-D-glutamyl-meso-diaminopimelate ligase [Blastocatellia bacterium]